MKRATIAVALLLCGIATIPASAQSQSTIILGGYGTTMYEASTADGFQNDFTASISPVMLYSMGPDLLFEAELEFGLNGAVTATTLEYAQIDYLGFENWQIIAGKFLVRGRENAEREGSSVYSP